MTFDTKLNVALAIFVISILSFGVFGLVAMKTEENEHRAACEAAGGYWFAPRNAEVCLRKEYVIPLK